MPDMNAMHTNPGWALRDIQSFSALIQRFLSFQRSSELNQQTLILTSLVITDSVMNINGNSNTQRPWKQPKKFFFNIDAEETRNQKFQNNFYKVILKNSKKVIFPKSVFPFDSMSEHFLLEFKIVKNNKIHPAVRKKNVTRVNFDVFTVFLGEHVKSLRQQC